MKIAFLTDLHIREDRLDGPGGQREILNDVVEVIRKEDPDLVLVGGDNSGDRVPHKQSIAERNVHGELRAEIATIAPDVEVEGNHDFPRDYEFLNLIGGRNPVIFCDEPELVTIKGVAQVMALPWIPQSRFRPGSDWTTELRRAYNEAIDRAAPHIHASDLPCFLLAHVAIADAMIREGQPKVSTKDPVLSIGDLVRPDLFEAAFFGHYHEPQELPAEIPACYGGSLFVGVCGESANKGITIYETGRGFRRIVIAQPRRDRIVIDVHGKIVEAAPVGGPFADLPTLAEVETWPAPDRLTGEVRVVVRVRDTDRAAATLALARWRGVLSGLYRVVSAKWDVTRTERAREGAADVAEAVTLSDKVAAFLARISPRPNAKTTARAIALAREVEAEQAGRAAAEA